ncbi:MAG: hypothetical protein QG639_565 [Patescibacteria group bacterium]|nr:hypothetical protein [Patescibacteria group bacterium]
MPEPHSEQGRPDILPKKTESQHEIVKALLKVDKVKILTARNPEQVMEDSGESFEDTFGLSRVLKALKAVFASGTCAVDFGSSRFQGEYQPDSIEDLYLKAAHYRKNFVRPEFPDMPDDQLDYELFKFLLYQYTDLGEDEFPPPEFLLQFKDDRLLNIGDPFQRINQVLDEPRVHTLDYESGEEAGQNQTRSIKDVVDPIANVLERWDQRDSSYWTAYSDLEFHFQHVPEGTDYDTDWTFGYTNPETNERVPGITNLVQSARELTIDLETNASTDNIRKVKDAWLAVRDKLYDRKRHHWEVEGKDITKPQENYDTDFGLHPIDYLSKSIAYMSNVGANNAAVLEYYSENIYPGLIHEYIEHLADAHTKAYEGQSKVEAAVFYKYQRQWRNFLTDRGFDSDNYNPYAVDSKFVDLLTEFFLYNGIKIVEFIDEKLYEEMEEQIKDVINSAFPTKVKSKEAKFIKGIFPYTQELPAESYDRVLASWSVSAHMFPEMSTEMFVDEIWKELDRLLAPGGQAVFYPIGHYGESAEGICRTIDLYNQKYNRNLTYELDSSGQSYSGRDVFANDRTLTVRKPL